jgi:opacity protein-like surface antigen
MATNPIFKSLSCMLIILLSATALAAERRPGEFEYTAGLVYTDGTSVDTRRGSGIDFSSRLGFQAGIDYYLSSRFALGFDVAWVEPNYKATLIPDDGSAPVQVNQRARVFTGQFVGTYNFLEGPLTPFVEATLGWTYFDSRVSSTPPVVGCWWDPWLGYVCSSRYRTYDETNLSYGMGLGLRVDLSRSFFAKATYRWLELDLDGGREKPLLESASVELGWRF